jgi:signal peptidase I
MNKILDKAFTVLLVIICGIILFVFNHTVVQGDSMKNSFQTGDRLILNLVDRNYTRGDVVTVFSDNSGAGLLPNSLNTVYQVIINKRIVLVKRVVAMPGEEVEMVDKKIIIYNSKYPQGYILDEPYAKNDWLCNNSQPNPDLSFAKKKVPEGSYFVMGDNRGCSQDSRYYGPFKKESILGKVVNKFVWLW